MGDTALRYRVSDGLRSTYESRTWFLHYERQCTWGFPNVAPVTIKANCKVSIYNQRMIHGICIVTIRLMAQTSKSESSKFLQQRAPTVRWRLLVHEESGLSYSLMT